MKVESQEFRRLFKVLRLRGGYSIKQLASSLGVSYPYISKIENGHAAPSAEFVEKVSRVFGYDTEELMVSAGKLPDDVLEIIKNNPKEAILYLRDKFGAD